MGSTYARIKKTLVCALLLAAAMLPTQTVHADIVSVTATPSSRNVAINRTTSISLIWNVASNGPSGTLANSTNGVFQNPVNNTIIGTVNKVLSGITTPPPPGSLIRFSEQVLVPASIIAKARKLGINSLLYTRIFSDNFSTMVPGNGAITLNITGSAGAGFNISREALSFTDK